MARVPSAGRRRVVSSMECWRRRYFTLRLLIFASDLAPSMASEDIEYMCVYINVFLGNRVSLPGRR